MHVRQEAVQANLQQHDERSAHILPDFGFLVGRQCKQVLRRIARRRGQISMHLCVLCTVRDTSYGHGKLTITAAQHLNYTVRNEYEVKTVIYHITFLCGINTLVPRC